MANNTITIHFALCGAAPASGYVFRYRPAGSGIDYRTSQNFFSSPAIIVDTNDAFGTEYEGVLQSDCGGGKLGPEIPWSTSNTGSASQSQPSDSDSITPEPVFVNLIVTANENVENVNTLNGVTVNGVAYTPDSGSFPITDGASNSGDTVASNSATIVLSFTIGDPSLAVTVTDAAVVNHNQLINATGNLTFLGIDISGDWEISFIQI